jgi:sRNA-binding carbon storage regulator CsrA
MQTKEKGGLVLTRKRGQSIEVDGPARIVVDRLGGGRVRLRILADRAVTVLRSEIAEREEGHGVPEAIG